MHHRRYYDDDNDRGYYRGAGRWRSWARVQLRLRSGLVAPPCVAEGGPRSGTSRKEVIHSIPPSSTVPLGGAWEYAVGPSLYPARAQPLGPIDLISWARGAPASGAK